MCGVLDYQRTLTFGQRRDEFDYLHDDDAPDAYTTGLTVRYDFLPFHFHRESDIVVCSQTLFLVLGECLIVEIDSISRVY